MKFILILIFPIIIFGQTQPEIYDLSTIKCDSIITYELRDTQEMPPKDRTVYIYNKLGENVLILDYYNHEVNTKTKFNWADNKITSTKINSMVYRYAPESKEPIGEIEEDSFEKLNYTYENSLLKKTEYYNSTAGNLELYKTTLHEYNSLNKLKKETFIDSYNGYLLHSNINSIQIDSITLKKNINYSYKTYEYKKEYIVINYFKKGELISKEKILGTIEKPSKITQFDKKGVIQKNVLYSRDLIGKIIDIKVLKDNFISTWGIETFKGNINNIKIKYNEKGNPIEIKYLTDKKIESIEKIEYHAP